MKKSQIFVAFAAFAFAIASAFVSNANSKLVRTFYYRLNGGTCTSQSALPSGCNTTSSNNCTFTVGDDVTTHYYSDNGIACELIAKKP